MFVEEIDVESVNEIEIGSAKEIGFGSSGYEMVHAQNVC